MEAYFHHLAFCFLYSWQKPLRRLLAPCSTVSMYFNGACRCVIMTQFTYGDISRRCMSESFERVYHANWSVSILENWSKHQSWQLVHMETYWAMHIHVQVAQTRVRLWQRLKIRVLIAAALIACYWVLRDSSKTKGLIGPMWMGGGDV